MRIIKCQRCGKEVETNSSRRKYCLECSKEAKKEKQNKRMREKRANDPVYLEKIHKKDRERNKRPERVEQLRKASRRHYERNHIPADRNGNNFCVYIHTDPVGKVYIGRAVGDNVYVVNRNRWSNGHGYKTCPRFYDAIKLYGWDNIQHEIIEWGLTYKQVLERERYWIDRYNSTNQKYGYNIT